MGGIASCSLTNKYNKKIWVKYDVERKYVNMEDYTIEGQVGFSEFSVGAGVSVSKRYDWVKIQSQFTPIASGSDSFIELAVECKDSKVMYVTIVAEDGEIICNTLGKTDKNLIVTEDGQLRTAHEKNFTEVHPRYGKMKTTDPGPLNKNALPVVSGTTTNTKR